MDDKYKATPLGEVEQEYLEFLDVGRPGYKQRIMPVFTRGEITTPMSEEQWALLRDAVNRYFWRSAWQTPIGTMTSAGDMEATNRDGQKVGEDGGNEPITKLSDNITEETEEESNA